MPEDINKLESYDLFGMLKIEKIFKDNNIPVAIPYSNEEIYKRVKEIYEQQTGTIENDEEKLYKWLEVTNRFPMLSILIYQFLSDFVNGNTLKPEFNTKDPFLFANLKPLFEIALDHSYYCFQNRKKSEYKLSQISKEEIEYHARNILAQISPEWLATYERLQDERRVVYLDELSEEQRKEFMAKYGLDTSLTNFITKIEGKYVIFITRKYTLYDVTSIVHEFAHYVSMSAKEEKLPRILSEFYSIFYEMYATRYFLSQNYSEEEVEALYDDRISNINDLILYSLPLFDYFIIFLEDGLISEERMIKKAEETIQLTVKAVSSDVLEMIKAKTPSALDPVRMACDKCDSYLETMLLSPDLVYESYVYIIGHYLSTNAFDKMAKNPGVRDDILNKIRLLAERKIEMDPYDIFLLCGVDNEKTKIQRVGEAPDSGTPKR